MSKKSPDTLQFFRNTLQQLEQAPDPAMDSKAVADLKILLRVRIAKLEADRPSSQSTGESSRDESAIRR
jgi:hypothetical protein